MTTLTANLVILYVKSPEASVAFYRKLLGKEPLSAFPTFSSFAMEGGSALGLWGLAGVKPEPGATGHRSELAFMVEEERVPQLYEEWKRMGVPIEQELTRMDFGPTFVGLDPDGHRLRVCIHDK